MPKPHRTKKEKEISKEFQPLIRGLTSLGPDIQRKKKQFDKRKNPYLACAKHYFGGDFKSSYSHSFMPFKSYLKLHFLREHFTKYYAWGIPDERVLKEIAKHSPIVEIGAGTGYWANQLKRHGVDIVAFDSQVEKKGPRWFKVKRGDTTAVNSHQDRTLFLCWPPYKTSMAYQSLKNYKGSTVIYVGEPDGCTGDEKFRNLLMSRFIEIKALPLPKWPGLHDCCFIYKRRSRSKSRRNKKPS